MANKVALITGASRGIGKQLAIDFADAGYDIVAVARSTAESPTKLPGTIDETAQLVRDAGQRCVTIGADLQEADAIDRIVDTTYAELGQVDVLINNAAVAPPGKALEGSRNRWRLAVDINVNAPFYLMHAICPRMAASGGGAVINIGSGASISPRVRARLLHDDQARPRSDERIAGARPRRHRRLGQLPAPRAFGLLGGLRVHARRAGQRDGVRGTRSSCPTRASGWSPRAPSGRAGS